MLAIHVILHVPVTAIKKNKKKVKLILILLFFLHLISLQHVIGIKVIMILTLLLDSESSKSGVYFTFT